MRDDGGIVIQAILEARSDKDPRTGGTVTWYEVLKKSLGVFEVRNASRGLDSSEDRKTRDYG
jgi:hypothetical protein